MTAGNCERARTWTSLQVDGELSELEQALLEAHLERCPDCKSFAGGLRGVEALLRAQPLEAPSRPVDVRRVRSGRSLRVLHASAAVAVVATGCLGALVVGIFHVADERPAGTSPQRVSVINDASPQTMRELRRFVLADSAARATRHFLNP